MADPALRSAVDFRAQKHQYLHIARCNLVLQFVKRWNSGALDEKFYAGQVEVPHAKWAFAERMSGDDKLKLDSLKDQIDKCVRCGSCVDWKHSPK